MDVIESLGQYELDFISESKISFEEEVKPKKLFDVSLFVDIDDETKELFVKIDLTPEDKQEVALSLVFPDFLTVNALPLLPVNVASFVDGINPPEDIFCRIISALLASEASLTIGCKENNEIYFLFQVRDFSTEVITKLDEVQHLFEYREIKDDNLVPEADQNWFY